MWHTTRVVYICGNNFPYFKFSKKGDDQFGKEKQ